MAENDKSYRERIEALENILGFIKDKKWFKNINEKINELEEQILLLCEAHENDLIFMNNIVEQLEEIHNSIKKNGGNNFSIATSSQEEASLK